MKRDPLLDLSRQKILDLRSQLATVRASIALLKTQGLIAAKGTAIASYKAQGSNGDYYAYYKLIQGRNQTLIHLGHEDSQWLELFRSAVERRSLLDDLENTEANSNRKSIISKALFLITIAIAFPFRRINGSNSTTIKAIAFPD